MLTECVILLGVSVLLCSALCAVVIIIMWQSRGSKKLDSFYYRCCWNESCINLFTLTFFLTSMYARYFSITFPMFYYLNRFKWWTKFAQTAEEMNNWKIFILQTFLPTVTVIPLYCLYDHGYGIRGITMPLWLSAVNPTYDKVISIIALLYRSIAFVLSFYGYISMFCIVRRKANRNEMRILIQGGILLSALLAAMVCTIVEGLDIGSEYAMMRLFYFTTILWVPCTDIITTFWIVASLRNVVNIKKTSETILVHSKTHLNAVTTSAHQNITNSENAAAPFHQ